MTGHEAFHLPGTIVACLGASIVRGQLGANLVGLSGSGIELSRFRFVNSGLNGDLEYNSRRVTDSRQAKGIWESD